MRNLIYIAILTLLLGLQPAQACSWFLNGGDGFLYKVAVTGPGDPDPCECGILLYKVRIIDILEAEHILLFELETADMEVFTYSCRAGGEEYALHVQTCETMTILIIMQFPDPIEDYEIDDHWSFGQLL